jgi:hypothetical protein
LDKIDQAPGGSDTHRTLKVRAKAVLIIIALEAPLNPYATAFFNPPSVDVSRAHVGDSPVIFFRSDKLKNPARERILN